MGSNINPARKKVQRKRISSSLSKIVFPEVCPVCMDEAEDLVALTIMESQDRWIESRSLVGGWMKSQNKVEVALQESRGGITFWIPACLQHGSDTITTPRKKIIAAIGFLLLIYPFIFYTLGIATALEFDRPLSGMLLSLILIICLIIIDIMYGFYPRALERSVKIENISRTKDRVIIILKNDDYRNQFLEQNALHAELLENMKRETNTEIDDGGK